MVRLRFASESLLATSVECTDKVKVIFRPQGLIKMKSDIRRLKQEILNKLKENLDAVATNAISTIVSGGKFKTSLNLLFSTPGKKSLQQDTLLYLVTS